MRRVDEFNPSHVEKCKKLGACPGGLAFGIPQTCWQSQSPPNQTLRFTECFGEKCTQACVDNGGGCADFELHPKASPCFTDHTMITRKSGSGVYQLQQNQEKDGNGTQMRCQDEVGARCCPGNTNTGCESCCIEENNPKISKTRSCNLQQWYSVDSSEKGFCHICPPTQQPTLILVIIGVLLLICAPVIAKLSELAKHAGAAQGPVLSIMNFFQSTDLFRGLDLQWPTEFRTFCRTVASLFSFNISELLKRLNAFISSIIQFHLPDWLKAYIPHLSLPPPACALHLSYEMKVRHFSSSSLPHFQMSQSIVLYLKKARVCSGCYQWRRLCSSFWRWWHLL